MSSRPSSPPANPAVLPDLPHAPPGWNAARRDLAASSPVMARIIAEARDDVLVPRGDPFQTLARSIVGQQISVQAAASVWARFEAACKGPVVPERVRRMRMTTLRGCGLSERKGEYIKDLAGHFTSGALDPSGWGAMDDEAVIEALVDVRGIGRWTAEMFLIFNLLRPDVWPLDDIGLLRAVGVHWHADPAAALRERTLKATRAEAVAIGEGLRPWRSVATWYLWRTLDPVPVAY